MIRVAFSIALAVSQPVLAQTISGTAQASDGDSLTVGDHRVRLFGVDAPEARQTCLLGHSNWACGDDAAAALRKLINNRPITCFSRDRDVYGRTVANCLVDGEDVAAQIVRQGYAVVLDNGQGDYAAVEDRAKAAKAGIWASTFDMPADYRRAHPREPQTKNTVHTTRWQAPGRVRSSGYMYRSCAQARAAGAAPMYRGQASYNPNLDGDGDGIACEPYRR